ncbi:MAG: tRNA (adenosine(37)-N6)-threonylcarbamoyltransferase complex ATPase subunit type 1 TsaE [Candidatus Paceibacterota bacterium]|jgi:tRNA threonylcarbamoyladenosine biosynthesis protein TsaE
MISQNTKETEEIAKAFLKKINPNKKGATIVGLYGELGTGKTTFSHFFAKNLGIKRKINSPTFVIMKRYALKHKDFENLFHLDAYRLKNEKELIHIGWKEIIANPKHIVFIEWPENIIKSIPKKHHKVLISHTKEGYRSFKIKTI